MPNGAAVALAVDPASGSACATVVPPTEVEIAIGELVATATIAVFAGMEEIQNGGLAPATRARAGDLFVEMYELQQAHLGEIDFATVARVQGKRILWARYGAAMREHLRYSEVELDAALDELIERPLVVLRRVTACERAWAN
jgi:hypothetical protein